MQVNTIDELFSKAGIPLEKNAPRLTADIIAQMGAGEIDKEVAKNANEVMHTSNTGYGAELVPVNVLSDRVVNVVPSYGGFLGALPGFQGTGMNATEKVPLVGDPGFFIGNSEATTGAFALAQGGNRAPTAEVLVTQASVIAQVDISKRLLNYSVADIQAYIVQAIAKSATRTIESMILNGDAETGGTGNVNSDDQAPATTFATTGGAADHRILIDHGMRELAINGSACTVNAGTFDSADFIAMLNILGDYAADPASLMWIFNRATYNKMLLLDEFKDAAKNGRNSTIWTGAINNIFGSDVVVARDMPKTEADGKRSATPGNNTLGQFGLVWKPAIQYGYGQPMELDIVKVPGKGACVIATMDFGFGIAQKQAGITDSSVALGINVTIA